MKCLVQILMATSLFTAMLASTGVHATSANKFVLSQGQSVYDVTSFTEYLEDTDNRLTFADVQTPAIAERFRPLVASEVQRGYNHHTHWLRFKVHNAEVTTRQWFLYFLSSELAICDFYVITGDKTVTSSGRGYLQQATGIADMPRQPSLQLDVPSGSSQTIYVRVRSQNFLGLNLNLVDRATFEQRAFVDTLFYGLFFGCVISLMFYNLCLFISLRDRLYLLYVLTGSLFTFNIAVVSGFGFILLPACRELPWQELMPPARMLAALSALQFARHFLQVKTYARRLDTVVQIFSLFIVSKCFLGMLVNLPAWLGDDLDALPTAALVLIAGSISYRAGYRPARAFMIAWGCLMASVVVWTLWNEGFMPAHYFFANAPLVGSMLELTLMSLALGQRYALLREADHKATVEKNEKQRLSNLVRVLCHDIANPLAVIQGTSRLALTRDFDADKNNRYWQKIDRASQILHEMIDQIRQMEAYKAGKMKPEIEAVSLRETFNNMLFIFDHRLKKKGVSISHNLGPDADDIFVMADKIMLNNNIINNVVSNAIKFSFPGGRIVVEACVSEDDDELVHVMVRDFGIGMPDTLISKLFDPAAETSRPGTHQEEGTGFGMPLVKSVTENLAGSIEIESRDQQSHPDEHGTIVHIYLPRHVPQLGVRAPSSYEAV